jgi:hypothetical protein
MAQGIPEHALALVHLLDIAGIAAEEIVLQMKTVLHHLETDERGGFGHVDRALSRRFGLVLAPHRHQIDRQ